MKTNLSALISHWSEQTRLNEIIDHLRDDKNKCINYGVLYKGHRVNDASVKDAKDILTSVGHSDTAIIPLICSDSFVLKVSKGEYDYIVELLRANKVKNEIYFACLVNYIKKQCPFELPQKIYYGYTNDLIVEEYDWYMSMVEDKK